MVKDLRLLRIKNNLLLYRWRFVENHQEKVLKEVWKERLEEKPQQKGEQKRMFLVKIRHAEVSVIR